MSDKIFFGYLIIAVGIIRYTNAIAYLEWILQVVSIATLMAGVVGLVYTHAPTWVLYFNRDAKTGGE